MFCFVGGTQQLCGLTEKPAEFWMLCQEISTLFGLMYTLETGFDSWKKLGNPTGMFTADCVLFVIQMTTFFSYREFDIGVRLQL